MLSLSRAITAIACISIFTLAACSGRDNGFTLDSGVPDRGNVRGDGAVDGTNVGPDAARLDVPNTDPDVRPIDVTSDVPALTELCDNGLDDDGDGAVDEGCPCLPGSSQRCYPGPRAQAGIGSCAFGMQACDGAGEFGVWGMCRGAQVAAGEMCNSADDDCDGMVDNGCECRADDMRACYGGPAATRGIGSCRDGVQRCASGAGGIGSAWAACAGETRPTTDVCDGIDNDCNGTIDDGCVCIAGETRRCYGGPTGTDGVGPCRAGTQTCGASGASTAWGTCAMQTLPSAELCDGIDNDCDGTIDDGCACRPAETRACYTGPMGTRSVGACADGMQSCVAGAGGIGSTWGVCTGQRLPTAETCGDSADNDCNGMTDDGCVCRTGEMRACYTGPTGTSGVGICRSGSQPCEVVGGVARWGTCSGSVLPGAEACDMIDNDCDGAVDDGCACTLGTSRGCYTGATGTQNVGPCRAGTQSCVAGAGGAGTVWGACSGQTLPVNETCNMVDDNCNGAVDDGVSCSGPTVMCPAPVVAPAGNAVTLCATATGASTYRWEVISAPPGSLFTLGSPTTACTTFSSVIVGTFTLRITVTDSMGRTATCTTTVTMQGHGLRVEMSWDTAATDLDLHMHNSAATAWFTEPNDCFFSNRGPRWDTTSRLDDPSLDVDDRDGLGPENIRVDAPVTTQTYTVGVHYWSGTPRSNATVRIYCGDVLVATLLRALNGGAALGANNDFWRVARVRFTSPSACTVTRVDDVITFTQSRAGNP